MTRVQANVQIPPSNPPTASWEKRLAGPDTIQKVMEGKVAIPTLRLLINAPSAIGALNCDLPSSLGKILQIASAWDLFLKSASNEEQEFARPAFVRFVDVVADAIGTTKYTRNAQEMLGALTLPELLTYDSGYILNSFSQICRLYPNQEKGISAFAHLENHFLMLYLTPKLTQYSILRRMLEFYEQNPEYLKGSISRGCARSISGLVFAHSKHMLSTNNLDLLAYGIAWGPLDLKDKLSLMERVGDNYPRATQIALFSKVMDLIPMLPLYNAPTSKEFYSEHFNARFPELRRAILYDAALSLMVDASEQIRLYTEAKRLLDSTGIQFVVVSPEIATRH